LGSEQSKDESNKNFRFAMDIEEAGVLHSASIKVEDLGLKFGDDHEANKKPIRLRDKDIPVSNRETMSSCHFE
jgi:hypothetical protein